MEVTTQHVSRWAMLRHKIYRFLWAKEIEKVNIERETYLALREDLKRKQQEFNTYVDVENERFAKYKASLTITDMVREKLQGFDPKLVDTEDDLPEVLGEIEDQDNFLSNVNALKKNPAFDIIAKYLVRNQIAFSVMEAENLEENNFGKATINGIELFQEEVDRLALIYDEKHKMHPEKFNKFEVIS